MTSDDNSQSISRQQSVYLTLLFKYYNLLMPKQFALINNLPKLHRSVTPQFLRDFPLRVQGLHHPVQVQV
jgi:hypothetical protein